MSSPKPLRGLFLTTLDIMEQVYSVPVEKREALLIKLTQERKAQYLGSTDKTAPELATEMIKKGIKAKSYVTGSITKKSLDNNPKV